MKKSKRKVFQQSRVGFKPPSQREICFQTTALPQSHHNRILKGCLNLKMMRSFQVCDTMFQSKAFQTKRGNSRKKKIQSGIFLDWAGQHCISCSVQGLHAVQFDQCLGAAYRFKYIFNVFLGAEKLKKEEKARKLRQN